MIMGKEATDQSKEEVRNQPLCDKAKITKRELEDRNYAQAKKLRKQKYKGKEENENRELERREGTDLEFDGEDEDDPT
ncbi:hypothetical protein ISN45_At01g028180 [Arabidopsis thaliana x Arabidopsis arenosa]|uniref:Uncharacterized protein n=2 Tax=Arabidopsis TaxID=3701 RepID=A0A8T2H7B0_ARASU|nr:hypothetical protein ISN45_At01g028180 [Arabidopsis thaliana x Arabidopsis arenosa]KAG7655735.1 hypothetical protein ISN44_As01g027860 [Arabidopsis suecica]